MRHITKIATALLSLVMLLSTGAAVYAAPVPKAASVDTTISQVSDNFKPIGNLTQNDISELFKKAQKSSSQSQGVATSLDYTYVSNSVTFPEVVEYPCTLVDGQWEYDDSVYTIEYPTSSYLADRYFANTAYTYTFAIVESRTTINPGTEVATYTDFNITPNSTYHLDGYQGSKDYISLISKNANPFTNEFEDQYDACQIPYVIYGAGGSYTFSVTNSFYTDTSVLTFNPPTTSTSGS